VAGGFLALRGLGGVVTSFIAGAAADRFGEKRVLVALLILAAATAATVPQLPNVWTLAVGFFFLGAFISATQPAFSALIIRKVPERQWTEVYAAEYWAINVGFMVTALAGGHVALWSYHWLFYIEAAGTLLTLGVVLWRLPASANQTTQKTVKGQVTVGQRLSRALTEASLALRDRLALVAIFSELLFCFCLAQMIGTLPLDMKEHGFASDQYGYVIFLNGALLSVVQIGAGWALARRSPTRVFGTAALLSGLGYGLLMVHGGSLLLIMTCTVIWTAGEMLDAPVRSALVGALSTPATRGRYMGLLAVSITIGLSLGPAVGGWLFQNAGRQVLWLVTAALSILAAVIRFIIAPRLEQRIRLAPQQDI